jgi:hypothetical protein
MAKRRRSEGQRRRALVRALQAEHVDLDALAERLGLDLEALGRLGEQAETTATLRSLRRLMDWQAELFLSRCRLHAATRLLALCEQASSEETARKAATELRKRDAADPAAAGPDAAGDESAGPMDPQRMLDAIERLGREMGEVDEATEGGSDVAT